MQIYLMFHFSFTSMPRKAVRLPYARMLERYYYVFRQFYLRKRNAN